METGMLTPMSRDARLTIVAILLAAGPGLAATITVDAAGGGDYVSIAEGIQAADHGDTVMVLPGTYSGPSNTDLDFGGKAIVVASSAGSDSTTIDCGGDSRAFLFSSAEDTTSVVRGFRIENGYDSVRGGGILCLDSSPEIVDCHFDSCTAPEGAGMYCADSPAVLIDCVFANNTALQGGGGIRILRIGAKLSRCTFYGNTAPVYGGAVYCCYSSPVIRDCTFYGNSAPQGGAIYGYDASPLITNTILSFSPEGTAVYCPGAGSFTISHCCVYGNAGGDSLCGDYHDNIYVDPGFCDASMGAFCLDESSPCVGAGEGGSTIGAWPAACPCGGSTDVPAGDLHSGARPAIISVSPNPSGHTISIELVQQSRTPHAEIGIYTIGGRLVSNISAPRVEDNTFAVTWGGTDRDGRRLASGVYLVRSLTPGFAESAKLVLLR